MVKKEEVLEYLRKNPDAVRDEFIVRSKKPTIRKTFEVDPSLVEDFMAEARKRQLKIKHAIDQALRQWIGKGR